MCVIYMFNDVKIQCSRRHQAIIIIDITQVHSLVGKWWWVGGGGGSCPASGQLSHYYVKA